MQRYYKLIKAFNKALLKKALKLFAYVRFRKFPKRILRFSRKK